MSTRTAFLQSADAVRALLDDPLIDARWNEPSALPMMTTGALTAHLTRAVLTVASYLDDGDPGLSEHLVDAPSYYTSIDGLMSPEGPDLTGSLHTGVRRRAEEAANEGPEAVRARWDEGMLQLHAALATEPATRTLAVIGGLRIMIDDYLVTRLVELVVHGDDLAATIGVEPPAFPDRGTELVIDCLVKVAVRRHGSLAVIRALARTERDTVDALRVL